MRNFELTDDEGDLLTLALGMALGAASRTGNRELGNDLVRLANSVHKNNPNWTPYAVEGKAKEGQTR